MAPRRKSDLPSGQASEAPQLGGGVGEGGVCGVHVGHATKLETEGQAAFFSDPDQYCSNRAKAIRIAKGWSLREASERIKEAGGTLAHGRLSQLENGKFGWSLRNLEQVAVGYGVSIWELLPLPGGQDSLEIVNSFDAEGPTGVIRWAIACIRKMGVDS